MNKTLMIAAAAAFLATGAAGFSATPAEAGSKFSIQIGYGGKGFHKGYHRHCWTEYRNVRVKIHRKHGYGYFWRWVKRPIRVCGY